MEFDKLIQDAVQKAVKETKIAMLNEQYVMLGELEDLFPKTSIHKAKTQIDKNMRLVLNKLKELK